MVFSWTRQFLIATGLFAFILTGHTVSIAVKEKQIADKTLKEAQRTVRVNESNQIQFN